MQNNAILLETLSIEQLQQLMGTSVKNEIQELQKNFKQKTILKNYLLEMRPVLSSRWIRQHFGLGQIKAK